MVLPRERQSARCGFRVVTGLIGGNSTWSRQRASPWEPTLPFTISPITAVAPVSRWPGERISALGNLQNPAYIISSLTKRRSRMGRPPIGTRAMTGAQRQRRYLAKRTRPAATPVATTTASVVELGQLQAQLEKLQRDTQGRGAVARRCWCQREVPPALPV
jgi:hypothetical protein